MSLNVYPYSYHPDGSFYIPELPNGTNTSVGAEATRTTLWSAPVVLALGATYLPRLADDDLLVPSDETGALLRECATLLTHLPAIARATRQQPTYEADEWCLESNLVNIIHVTHWARAHDYGVLIW